METNYFVCTLGQAALRKNDARHESVNAFFQYQAREHHDEPAVGFFMPNSTKMGKLKTHVLTFGEIQRGSSAVAYLLKKKLGPGFRKGETVALLCPSTADFLFTWLALMHIGAAVLLIAPQLQPSAISHLCNSCEVNFLIYDQTYAGLAERVPEETKRSGKSVCLVQLSDFIGEDVLTTIESNTNQALEAEKVASDSISYIFHTSGTSSGMPKPIPQSHNAAVGVLPHLRKEPRIATFTTTPLYHGGISDCFRAWTSDALIWLFPGKGMPITAGNIVRCLNSVPHNYNDIRLPQIKYFTSVPYVLQMMGEDEMGLTALKGMDLVGVGGAALSSEVGDRLVEKGVNIVSRYGSAECGFLLSSHRDYGKDSEWQYLRTDSGMEHISLEEREGGLVELVVLPGWPHMAKTNREDGSFATSDQLVKHPDIQNAWRYHSRADSQLTLVTGKKFDPAPMEDSLAASALIQDALIFGNDQPYPGVLIFRGEKQRNAGDEDYRQQILPLIDNLNKESQSHAQIPKGMMVLMAYDPQPLEKSSKGTVMRKKAEEKYADTIKMAYEQSEGQDAVHEVHDENMISFITDSISKMTSKETPVEPDTDLYAYGLDSVSAIRLRRRLQFLLPKNSKALPMSIVEDCGTPEKLGRYITDARRGKTNDAHEDDEELMLKLVDEYGNFEESTTRPRAQMSKSSKDVIVLTGASGALGAHILDQCRRLDHVGTIYCLIRGADSNAASERVDKSLQQKGLSGLKVPVGHATVVVIAAKLGADKIGLDDATYDKLAAEATAILHVAWEVNFRMKLRNFAKDNISGLHNMLELALSSTHEKPPGFLYCSSTASVTASKESTIAEVLSKDPATSSPLGYARSKWVAEQICARANQSTKLNSHISVLRVGQLAGDTERGIWNVKEAWPIMLDTVRHTGFLPALRSESLDWLPVDLAAGAFVQVMQHQLNTQQQSEMPVYHILNPNKSPSWMDMIGWLQKRETFQTCEPSEWVQKLSDLQQDGDDHPAMKLLGLWQEAYGETSEPDSPSKATVFETVQTAEVTTVIGNMKPLDEAYFEKVWTWIIAAFREYNREP